MTSVQTLDELIELLQDVREEMGGDVAPRVAYQPAYPLAGVIKGVTVPLRSDDPDDAYGAERGQIWLAIEQDSEMPYAPSWAWNCDGGDDD